ncbi:hypothetical protein BJX63DRAFT_393279 [Aspergillus granulosus]|uniref:Secreted protein n=1 Tax=Aspergillus granulosus TaxID=176169 RepID=A0ABR4HET3_9EURO
MPYVLTMQIGPCKAPIVSLCFFMSLCSKSLMSSDIVEETRKVSFREWITSTSQRMKDQHNFPYIKHCGDALVSPLHSTH